jgi:hypothetical protein
MCESAHGDKHPTGGEKIEENDIKVLVMRLSNAYYTQSCSNQSWVVIVNGRDKAKKQEIRYAG